MFGESPVLTTAPLGADPRNAVVPVPAAARRDPAPVLTPVLTPALTLGTFLLGACLLGACGPKQARVPAEQSARTEQAPLQDTISHPRKTPTGKAGAEPAAQRPQPGALVWERIRAGLRLREQAEHAEVQKRIRWFTDNAEFLEQAGARARPYLVYIVDQVEKRGLPMELALLPFIESGFHPYARSPMRALGIWQFIPGTGRIYGLRQDYWYDGRRDLPEATGAALSYLQKIHGELGGDWLRALAAYNSGEKRVARRMKENRARGKGTSFWDLRLPRETRSYVPSLLAVASIIADPERYGVSLTPIPDRPHFDIVPIDGPLDLAYAAELAGLELDELYALNAGFKRWCTAPQGPHRLLVPVAESAAFRNKIATLRPAARTGWHRYVTRRGDELPELAALYGLEAKLLAEINGLESAALTPGTTLRIPAPKYAAQRYASALYGRYSGPRVATWERDGAGGIRHLHVVRRGESLWRIARRYRTSLERLRLWNPRLRGNLLQPGQRLVVWRSPQGPERKALRVASADNAYHVVHRGESLWRIARRYDLSLGDLRRWNRLPAGNRIYAGQRIRVQTPDGAPAAREQDREQEIRYVVRKGDSLWGIARRFKTSVRMLLSWNQLGGNGRHLHPGQNLRIYRSTP